MRRSIDLARTFCVRARAREEDGIALVMALGIMIVLTLVLTTVITFTAAGARDANRSNAGQKATSLAEGGLANAFAVLNQNYPGTITYPGDASLLPPRTTNDATGSVTWSGVIENAPSSAFWRHQWRITAVGSVPNPTGPTAADVTRRLRAIVPIVIPDTVSVDPSTSSLNWVYANLDIVFGQSVEVAAPVYARRDLTLSSTAQISEIIPATAVTSASKNRLAVGRDFMQLQTHNQVGRVHGTAHPANSLAAVYVQGRCSRGGGGAIAPHGPPCLWGDPTKIWGVTTSQVIPPGLVDPLPKLTCCAPVNGTLASAPAEPVTIPPTPSVMGFWYQNAFLGPNTRCDPAQSSGAIPRFDRATGVDTADGWIDQSATNGTAAFDLTGATYTCKSGNGELSYNASTKVLTINGPIFIDGSARSTERGVTYVGQGALILSGTFQMLNGDTLCVEVKTTNPGSGDCVTTTDWNPNTAGMFVFAAGDFATDPSTQGTSTLADVGIEIKAAQYQGGLFAARQVQAIVSGTVVQGPMVSAYAHVAAGQSGVLQFPPISFPTSGSSGFVGPLPLPKLLPPQQFEGG